MNRSQQRLALAVVSVGLIIVSSGAAVLIRELRNEREARQRLEEESARFKKKLLGRWRGQNGCSGEFHFHADGTYELRAHGPAGEDSAGTWYVRRDAVPPTLVLTCRSSSWPEEVGLTRGVKLLRLDDQNLAVDYSGSVLAPAGVDRYARAGEEN